VIVLQDLLSGQDVSTDSYPSKPFAGGAITAMESKMVNVGSDEDAISKAIGANESKEEAGEKMDSDKKQVINIVNAHDLQKMELEAKELKDMIKSYWTKLKKKMDSTKFEALGLGADYKPPSDKKAAADAETAAEAKLSAGDKAAVVAANKRLDSFKNNFKALSEFWTKEVFANIKEFDFYIPGGGAELGNCILIPARFVGEATTPTFYFMLDGVVEQKF